MVQKSFPFADNDGDREYNDTDFAEFYGALFTNGVFMNLGNALQVSQSPTLGMRVNIGAGAAMLNGRIYFNTETTALTIPVASTMQDRTDSVVIRLDLAQRTIEMMYKSSDVSIIRNDMTYELQLATITVPKNANSVSDANIVDKRANDAVCGYSSPFEKVNVSGLENQYQQMLQDVLKDALKVSDKNKSDQQDVMQRNQSLFQEWFKKLGDALSGDVAGNLQLQINKLNADAKMAVEIKHNLGGYPIVHAIAWEYGLGLVGLGDEPEGLFGGTNVKTIPVNAEYIDNSTIKLSFTDDFVLNNPIVTNKDDGSYLLADGHSSIGITLQSGFTN